MSSLPRPVSPSFPAPFLSRTFRSNVHSTTAPLQGLRVLSNIAIVMNHTAFFSLIMLDVAAPVEEILLARSGVPGAMLAVALLTVSSFAVDIFLLISGFCMMAGLAKLSGDTGVGPLDKVPIRRNRMPLYALGRYLRLMPVYLCVAAATYLMGWNPCIHAEEVFFSKLAKNQIERLSTGGHLLASPFCIVSAWSLEIDFQIQMLVLMLAAIIPSWNGLQKVMFLLAIASGIYSTITWATAGNVVPPPFCSVRDVLSVQELYSFESLVKFKSSVVDALDPTYLARQESALTFFDWYMDIFSRCGALLIGGAVWIAMRNNGSLCRTVRKRPMVSLTVSGALFCTATASLGYFKKGRIPWLVYLAFGFHRILCVLSVGLIVILTCSVRKESTAGKEGRLVMGMKSFLGARVFLWLSRSSYVVFLIHPIAGFSLAWMWPRLTKDTLSFDLLLIGGLRWYFVSVMLSVPFCIIEEAGLSVRGILLRYMSGETSKPFLTERSTRDKAE